MTSRQTKKGRTQMTGITKYRPTASMVVAVIALFAAFGGGAYAAQKAAKNSVVSKSIKNGQVKGVDVKDGNLTGADLLDDSLTGADVDESSLKLPEIPAKVADADKLDGADSTEFYRWGNTIPSGTTIRGVFGGRQGVTGELVDSYISFPLPAPQPVTDATVNVAAGSGTVNGVASDEDGSCNGNVTIPSAPAGKVCLYVEESNLLGSNGTLQGRAVAVGGAGFYGFEVRGPLNNAGASEVHGTWAYTAP